jgi:glutamine synthetase
VSARDGGAPEAERQAAAQELLAALPPEIETVRVVFPDAHGILRGKTLVASALGSAFRSGVSVPSTLLLKDTSHRTAFPVWSAEGGPEGMRGAGDMLLVPDPSIFRPLPWSPKSAWLLCDAVHRDGTPIPFAPRTVLRRAVDRLADRGLRVQFGLEVEFHVFAVEDAALDHAAATMPGRAPRTRNIAQGWQFLTDDRYAQAEPVLDRIRRMAQGLGLALRSVEVEMGPSQFEVTFDPGAPMAQADAMVMFRAMAKQVCAQEGLLATFMPKPKLENSAASGWHIHQSVMDTGGRNLMAGAGLTDTASAWIAGLLAHAAESCLLIAPTVNSYRRFAPFQLAPNRIQWGADNRGAMVRALVGPDDPASRLENRAPDASANPYFAFAAQILSGLSGVEQGLTAPPPSNTPYDGGAPLLPCNLGVAIDAFAGSALYGSALGAEVVDWLTRLKRHEWDRYLGALSEWEQDEYFALL